MSVSRVDQSKGRWWDSEGTRSSECLDGNHHMCQGKDCKCSCHGYTKPKGKVIRFLFRKLKDEVCVCNRKASWTGGVWSYGEYQGKFWKPVRHFCKICFDKEVRQPLMNYFKKVEAEGDTVELRPFIKGGKLPAWLTIEPRSLDEVEVLELPSGRVIGAPEPPPKKVLHLMGCKVEVVGDYEGQAVKETKRG